MPLIFIDPLVLINYVMYWSWYLNFVSLQPQDQQDQSDFWLPHILLRLHMTEDVINVDGKRC